MTTIESFRAVLADIDVETTRIGNQLHELVAQLERTDLTELEEQEILAGLTAAANKLKLIGNSNPEQEPEIPV